LVFGPDNNCAVRSLSDLSEPTLAALQSREPVTAYMKWMTTAPDHVKAGLAAVGSRLGDPALALRIRRVARFSGLIAAKAADHEREQVIVRAWERCAAVVGDDGDVRITTLVGLGTSDASSISWRHTGHVFLWLENWLGPKASRGELQDRSVEALPSAIAHELGHAFRGALPESASRLRSIAAELDDPWKMWVPDLPLSLREAMVEEGIAVAFSLFVYPDLKVEQALNITSPAVSWLEAHLGELLAARGNSWDFDRPRPDVDWLRDALYFDSSRLEPPWSLDRPPTKWGYFAGMRIAKRRLDAGVRAMLTMEAT
jgi:hypothetical protein